MGNDYFFLKVIYHSFREMEDANLKRKLVNKNKCSEMVNIVEKIKKLTRFLFICDLVIYTHSI